MQVVFEIHGDLPDAGSRASVLCDAPLSLRKIQALFPFEGTFHFRIKISGRKVGLNDCEFIWLDIVDLDREIDCEANVVEIRALALEIPECLDGTDNNYDDYIEDMSQYIPSDRLPSCEARPLSAARVLSGDEFIARSSSGGGVSSSSGASGSDSFFSGREGGNNGNNGGSGSGGSKAFSVKSLTSAAKNININLNTVKSGASSIWSKVKATAAHIQQQAATASSEAATAKLANEMLALLAKDVQTGFVEDSAYHQRLLARLWEVQFPHIQHEYQRNSPTWKLAGWQKEDPVGDLKNSGLLALHSLIYLGEAYAEANVRMLQSQQANKRNNYPFAIVGVNLTLLLVELIKLRDPQ